MRIGEIFSGNFLKAEDLQGRTVPVTISKVEVKEFDDGKKIILHFEGKDKSLVCNKTNCSIIADNLGSDDTDNWPGRRITLTVKKVEFQGKLVPAIRVVLQEPAQTQPAPRQAPAQPAAAPFAEEEEPGDSVPF